MNNNSDKIQLLVSERRIKLHVFQPSMREIWTVVGKGEEYWIDPIDDFCSCPAFHFGVLNGKSDCYHLKSAKIARNEKKFETIIFSDDEFSDFLYGLICNL